MEYLLFSGRWLLLPNNLKSNLLEQCGTRSLEQKYLGIGNILSRFITWCQTLTSSRNISTTPAFIWGRQSKCCKKNKKSEKLQCSLNCVNSKIFSICQPEDHVENSILSIYLLIKMLLGYCWSNICGRKQRFPLHFMHLLSAKM